MPQRNSVSPDERIRLFVGFPLPEDSLRPLVDWQTAELGDLEGVRLVPSENLHITVAFLGHRPAYEVEPITGALEEACDGRAPPTFQPKRYRETRTVGMLVFDDEADRGTIIAGRIGKRLEKLGVYKREQRPWLAHATVLRFKGDRPRARPTVPELGAFSPSEVALYHSVLRSSGAQYEILQTVRLGG